MLEEIFRHIITIVSSSIVTALILLWFFVKNPEKVEKWVSMFLRLIAYFSEKAEKSYMATNIQATIAEKRKKLGIERNVLAYGIQVKWTNKDSAEIDLKENKVIAMMKPYKSQAKNFASIVSLYVPRALLPRSRRFVDQDLMTSIDYTISKTILEDNPVAMQYFVHREAQEHSEETKEWIRIVALIHDIGRLTRVVIPELQDLSSLYPLEPNPQIYKETAEFAKEIHRFETIVEPTEEEAGAGVFSGENIKMAIVPVGKAEKLLVTGIQSHLNFIDEQVENGILHFYVVSSGTSNSFAKLLAEGACKESGLSLIFSEEYEGLFRGEKRRMFCALCSKGSL